MSAASGPAEIRTRDLLGREHTLYIMPHRPQSSIVVAMKHDWEDRVGLSQSSVTAICDKVQHSYLTLVNSCRAAVFRQQEQASWVCECDDVIVHQVEMEVKKIFQHHYGLEQWAGWLDEITTHLLQEHIGSTDFARAARQLILKWTFYRSVGIVIPTSNVILPLLFVDITGKVRGI